MKNKMRFLAVGMLSGLVLFLASCSSTKVTSSWKEPDASINTNQKILVMALVSDREGSLRNNMEKEFVASLKQRGYNAVSAYDELGPHALKGLNEQKAMNRIRKTDADQVLTIVMLDKSKEKNYVPGRNWYMRPYPMYYGRFWPYYNSMYSRIYEPGYYTTNTKYFLESNLYNLRDKQLVYSVQTETFDPSSAARMAVVYSQQVIKDMTKQQLISKR
ncbi:hypothetical protein [Chitinophaga sp. 22620]|jgi:hypothetical protein|uniref:hypothetical protein n=1 Tax=Chitinophaga sp. 22620 TaxID=3453952 RepID=UPI003F83EB1D